MSIEFLRRLQLFKELKDADLAELYKSAEELAYAPGQIIMEEGSPPDALYVILDGDVEILKQSGGQNVSIAVRRAGEVLGELSLLAQTPRTASVRALVPSQILKISAQSFKHLLACSPSAPLAMMHTIMERLRNTESMLHQSEKMASLGTMAAGLAHELNNPAAAAKRSVTQLQQTLRAYADAASALGAVALDARQTETIAALRAAMDDRAQSPAQLDPLTRSDRESEMQEWLEERGVERAWDIAPTLVTFGWKLKDVEGFSEIFVAQLPIVLDWLAHGCAANALLNEVALSAERISEIVKAVKSYSYLDQAPIQNIDLHEGIENTLVILRHKLKNGITVTRQYAPALPRIEAYGSELNQVWTNLIDNAVDAMQSKGELALSTRLNEGNIVVEICDNGPGIPPEIQARVFEPFFTTKAPGVGTGLGLNITYNIIQKHHGKVELESQPGKTCFRVSLPLKLNARDK
ncbi:MAG: cyclic nucleotide-binding domain-containing protein [Chloroflexi bacterium]|nr:cyclic nucleotide-binding domain-containing protein [Chloroflexota bacterium]